MTHQNLLGGPPRPPARRARAARGTGRRHPRRGGGRGLPDLLAGLGHARRGRASSGGRVVESYAYARTGYHRGLDALRRSGWKGHGPVPWEHEPNRGFLRALHALARAAAAIGEDEEYERCRQFLADLGPRPTHCCSGLARATHPRDGSRQTERWWNRPLPRFRTSSGLIVPRIAGDRCPFGASDSNLPSLYAEPMSALDVWGLDDAPRGLPGDAAQPRLRPGRAARHLEVAPASHRGRGGRAGLASAWARQGSGGGAGVPRDHAGGAGARRAVRPRRAPAPGSTLSGPACRASRPTTWSGSPAAGPACRSSCSAWRSPSSPSRTSSAAPPARSCSCHPAVNIDVDAPAYVELLGRQLAGGRPMRGLYPRRARGAGGWRTSGTGPTRASRCGWPTGPSRRSRSSAPRWRWSSADGSGNDAGRLLVRAPALVASCGRCSRSTGRRPVPLPLATGRRRARETAPEVLRSAQAGHEGRGDGPPARRLAAHGPPPGGRPHGPSSVRRPASRRAWRRSGAAWCENLDGPTTHLPEPRRRCPA